MKFYQIDAFADQIFEGNPAAVVPLKSQWLPESIMQKFAEENNLSETVFFFRNGDVYEIRWFTPVSEVNLCGHATLAAAHVIYNNFDFREEVLRFNSRSGPLSVYKKDDLYYLDFPVSKLEKAEIKSSIYHALSNSAPISMWTDGTDLLLEYGSEKEILNMKPNFDAIAKLPYRGIIVTAKSVEYDFVSRFFAPAHNINEDPVTGSAHTSLVPFWAEKLNKNSFFAKQVSKRGGKLTCHLVDDRVHIGGKAVTFMIGEIINLPE